MVFMFTLTRMRRGRASRPAGFTPYDSRLPSSGGQTPPLLRYMWIAGSPILNPPRAEAAPTGPSTAALTDPLPCAGQGPFGTSDPAPTFEEPWQAQIFALVVQAHQAGAFSWSEWSAMLGEVMASRSPEEDPWSAWPAALERLLVSRGIAAPGALVALRQAWRLADEATPHGEPVSLKSGSRRLFGGAGLRAQEASAASTEHGRIP